MNGPTEEFYAMRARIAELEAELEADTTITVAMMQLRDEWHARAEKAEARIAELEAELASVRFSRNANWAAADKAEARLAAVIALCDEAEERALRAQFRDLDDAKCRRDAMVWGVKVRAAATGDPT